MKIPLNIFMKPKPWYVRFINLHDTCYLSFPHSLQCLWEMGEWKINMSNFLFPFLFLLHGLILRHSIAALAMESYRMWHLYLNILPSHWINMKWPQSRLCDRCHTHHLRRRFGTSCGIPPLWHNPSTMPGFGLQQEKDCHTVTQGMIFCVLEMIAWHPIIPLNRNSTAQCAYHVTSLFLEDSHQHTHLISSLSSTFTTRVRGLCIHC